MTTKEYLNKKYPAELYLTRAQVNKETGGMAGYLTPMESGLYLISEVAKLIYKRAKPKQTKPEIIRDYTDKLKAYFGAAA